MGKIACEGVRTVPLWIRGRSPETRLEEDLETK
jgi:hypothetical protein